MNPALARRALSELLGTGLLVTVVVGSGIMATRLSPGQAGLELLENSTATALGLGVLIVILAPVSGAHFNPVITLVDHVFARRRGGAADARVAGVYLSAQVLGGLGGTALANLMFGLPAATFSTHARTGGNLWLGEAVATAGLVLLAFGLARTGRGTHAPAAIGAYIGAAYWFTSSTSFANPAVTIARALTNSFAGISPASVPGFVAAQLVGAAIGASAVLALFPGVPPAAAPAAVVPSGTTPVPASRSSS